MLQTEEEHLYLALSAGIHHFVSEHVALPYYLFIYLLDILSSFRAASSYRITGWLFCQISFSAMLLHSLPEILSKDHKEQHCYDADQTAKEKGQMMGGRDRP